MRQLDLLAVAGDLRLGFCFCGSPLPRTRDWFSLRKAARRGVIQRGFLLYPGDRAFLVCRKVEALPLPAWLRLRPSSRNDQEARLLINSGALV